MAKVIVHTDGACYGNPGPGGWAALISIDGNERMLSGGEHETTNNRMELLAALKALGGIPEALTVAIYTDSEYLRLGITEWLPEWKANNWKRKGGRLKNKDLWQQLDAAIHGRKVEWHWLKGHAGNTLNERVDRMARVAMRKYL
ncbi:MAG: ribonuclease HI [Anaerolineaceae bacterium]|nr:ribonuclease HI [Anaerolineaceae bacterium]MBN2677238.1 ribonuclease HI [Anaerolineaceae bacterium]